jgi:hypothetical protein
MTWGGNRTFEIFRGHESMSERPSEPMPEDLREAFRNAIDLYREWKLGAPERSVSFRTLLQVSLSGVCDLVLSYSNELLPVKVHDELWILMDDV